MSGPTYREQFRQINGAPLAAGAVRSASSRDATVFGRERYVLRGGIPDATVEVRLLVYPFDPTCSSRPLLFAATALHTDRSGDGSAGLAIRREDVPGAVRNASHGLRWEIWHGDAPVYRTGCVAVTVSDSGIAARRTTSRGGGKRHTGVRWHEGWRPAHETNDERDGG